MSFCGESLFESARPHFFPEEKFRKERYDVRWKSQELHAIQSLRFGRRLGRIEESWGEKCEINSLGGKYVLVVPRNFVESDYQPYTIIPGVHEGRD